MRYGTTRRAGAPLPLRCYAVRSTRGTAHRTPAMPACRPPTCRRRPLPLPRLTTLPHQDLPLLPLPPSATLSPLVCSGGCNRPFGGPQPEQPDRFPMNDIPDCLMWVVVPCSNLDVFSPFWRCYWVTGCTCLERYSYDVSATSNVTLEAVGRDDMMTAYGDCRNHSLCNHVVKTVTVSTLYQQYIQAMMREPIQWQYSDYGTGVGAVDDVTTTTWGRAFIPMPHTVLFYTTVEG